MGPTVIIDNYDSFTYNIYQILGRLMENAGLKNDIQVYRNDEISVAQLVNLAPSRLLISPGPGIPDDAGISVEAIRSLTGKIPILGICLGLQCLATAFGGKIVQARNIVHGKVERISIDGKGVLRNLGASGLFTRYHSLAVDPALIPDELEVSAWAADGEIMGLRHRNLPIEGLQFHPESIGSEVGPRILANFLNWRREPLNRRRLLNQVIEGNDLSKEEAGAFMEELTDGALDDGFTAGILVGLAAKGVSANELAACASVLVRKRRVVPFDGGAVLDTCGTGGDEMGTFNISSFSALLAASCGATVAKHGNKAVSSRSGSTDFFAALGIRVDLDPEGVAQSIREEGFAYMAAPIFHNAMRHAGPVRAALGIKTLLNCLGPLVNPVGAEFQIIGVYKEDLLQTIARAAKILGVRRIMTLHSGDGLDEISPAAPTNYFFIDEGGRETNGLINPEDLGISGFKVSDLRGGDGAENARVAEEIVRGRGPGAIREAVCLNTGAALFVCGMAKEIGAGYQLAKKALRDGRLSAKLESLRCRR